mmetsp:Transcript_29930/g.73652  ORF Transcript_29930/g.73652 Transcript_29930/m.73652 type:complete len:342 (-) Transcript_29930:34-1059(-)
MPPRPGRGEGVALLERDSVQEAADNYEALNLSGSIDILWQLRGMAINTAQAPDTVVDVKPEDGGPEEEDPANGTFMAEFFEDVKGVKAEMGMIRTKIKEVKELQAKIITEVSVHKSKEYTEKLDNTLRETSLTAKKVKDHLSAMEASSDKTVEKHGEDSSEARTHKNMHGALTRKFVELMGEYQEVQSTYKKHLRDRVARQVKVANPAATEEEIEKAVDSGGGDIFTDKLLSKADQTALNAYADVQSKHEELIKLESSIREVHQLFLDMALLVEQQGELLDNIEDMVSHASTYTEAGVVQLVKAKELHKKMRKKMCCLAVCFAVTLLILITFMTNMFIPRF